MKSRWPRLLPESLVGRVYLLYAVTWLLFIATSLGLFYQSQLRQRIDEEQLSAAMLIEVVAQTVGESAVIGDYDTIARTLEKSIISSSFSAAQFIDLSGGRLRVDNRPERREIAPLWLRNRVASELDEINRTIAVGGKDYGILRLSFDANHIAAGIWSVVRMAALLSLMSILGGLLLIWYPLRRWLGNLQRASAASGADERVPAGLDAGQIEHAPLEFRQTLRTLQATAERLRGELDERERALTALRGVVAGLMSEQGDLAQDDANIEQLIVTISRLVAERERAAQQMREARDAADAANRAKSDFLANMSHEIRTPMNGVIGMIELALDTSLNEQQRDYLATARGSADSLLAIINEILDFSKIEAGKVSVESIPVALHVLLEESLKPARLAAEQKGLALRLEIAAETPAFVSGDPVRLRQILNNLVSNAIKFTSQGAVTVSARVRGNGREARLLLAVQDTGIGIAPDRQHKIFDAFSQEDDSTTRRFGGTGLGLTICRKLAGLMGGDIVLHSQPGAGSAFTLDIPLREAPAPAAAPVATPSAAMGDGGAGLDVLVAEDNAVNQKLTLALLRNLGHRTRLAQNGEEAVRMWGEEHFDIILMDMHMPVMGGIEATRRIRALEAERGLARIQIHALTAAAMADEQQQGLEAGLDGYLTKPISRAALADTLSRVAAALR